MTQGIRVYAPPVLNTPQQQLELRLIHFYSRAWRFCSGSNDRYRYCWMHILVHIFTKVSSNFLPHPSPPILTTVVFACLLPTRFMYSSRRVLVSLLIASSTSLILALSPRMYQVSPKKTASHFPPPSSLRPLPSLLFPVLSRRFCRFIQVMGARSRYTEEFVEFLKQCPPNTRVTFDQWSSFLEFSNTVTDGFEGYDEDGACKHSFLLAAYQVVRQD